MITTRGPVSLARSHSMAIASNSCSRIDSPSVELDGSAASSGSSVPRTGRAMPAHSSTWSRPY